MWFIGVEVEQETSALPPKKNPGSAPATLKYISACAIFSCPKVESWSPATPVAPPLTAV